MLNIVLISVFVSIFKVSGSSICYDSVPITYTVSNYDYVSYVETYKERCGFLMLKTCTRSALRHKWAPIRVSKTRIEQKPKCCEGYSMTRLSMSNTAISCKPVCLPICENGECIAPNTCKCQPGYELNEATNVCEPVCTTGCPNGHCKSPGICDCNTGYININQTCTPDCKNTCENGLCEAPMNCTCNIGFTRINDSCQPLCKNNCSSHGSCIAPDECLCISGYNYNHTSLSCEPECPQGCINGKCIRPYECICEKGFEFINGKCDPVCKNNCSFQGSCLAPDVCLCNKGYTYHSTSLLCVPECPQGCENGKCIRPNECVCENSFNFDHGRCDPVCFPKCINGSCIAPNKCICNLGYNKSNILVDHICTPICTGCTYGTCDAPNMCVCQDGYEYNLKSYFDPDTENNFETSSTISLYENYEEKCIKTTTLYDSDEYYTTSFSSEFMSSFPQDIEARSDKSPSNKRSQITSWIYVGVAAGCIGLVMAAVLVFKRRIKYFLCSRGDYIIKDNKSSQDSDSLSVKFTSLRKPEENSSL